jgi:hypothetical protein
VMRVEETMWDVVISQDQVARDDEELRTALARVIADRLHCGKKLLRVLTWSANAGCLFAPKPGVRRYAVAYEVVAPA